MSSRLKHISYVVGALILFVGLMLGFTQTSVFRNWLKNQLVTRAGKYLNGKLTIDRLDGSLFTNLQLTGVLLSNRQDTVVYIPKLKINHTLSRLLHMELQIDSVTIDAPYIKFVQASDSSWNVSGLLRSDSLAPVDTTKRVDTSGFRVLLNDFILREGSVRVVALDTNISSSVRQIGLQFSIRYSDTAQQLGLKGLRFSVDKPKFRLEELSLTASRRGKKISLGNLVIRTAKNQMGGAGVYAGSDSSASSGSLAGKAFDFSEFQAIIPGLTLYGNPSFEIETELERDSLVIKLGVVEPPQRIDLRLDIADVSKTLSATTRDLARYYAKIKLTAFDLTHWLGDSTISCQADGTIDIAGKGLTPQSADGTIDVHLTDLRAVGRSIGKIDGMIAYKRGNVTGQITGNGQIGEMKSEFSVDDLLNQQDFKLSLATLHLNLSPLMQNDSLASNLNFTAGLQGSGFDTSRFKAEAEVSLGASDLLGYKIDTAFARGSFTVNSYHIDTLGVVTSLGRASVAGNGTIKGRNDLKFWAKLESLSPLRQILKADTLSGSGVVSGKATGTLDSMEIASDLEFHKLTYNSMTVDVLRGHLAAIKDSADVTGTARMSALRPGNESYAADSIIVSSKFSSKVAELVADAFYRPGIDGHVMTRIAFDSTSTIAISDLALNFGGQHWKGGSAGTRVTFRGDDYRIDSLILTSPSDSATGVQSISVNGLFSRAGTEDLGLKVERLDLEKLTTPFNLPYRIGGRLSGDLKLSGTASAPILAGKFAVNSGLVNQFSYQALHLDLSYNTQKLTWNLSLIPYKADSLSIDGFVPVALSLVNSEGRLLRDQPFSATVMTTGLPLAIIQASGQPFKQVQGLITADVKISNTINSPTVSGNFGLRDGTVSLPRYGVDYTGILVGLSVHDATLTLDTLQARRDQGYLTGSGSLQFERSLLSGTIKTTQVDLVANKFYLINHKDYQVRISGDAKITGPSSEQKFAGSITILNSNFYLPALMEEVAAAQAAANRSMPLLVKATLNPDTLTDSISSAQARVQLALDTSHSDWYRNLRGQFKVTIPRNTWLKSPDMNLEIGEGDIDLVKNGLDFEIFGSLKILRGQYNLYGKRFTILQGTLLFQGGSEYNPEVSMQAQYVFRTAEREKKTLSLDVSGKAFNPVLAFTLDGDAIEERDALAYVMYGRSMDELTSGQKSSAGAAQGELAKGAAANMISNQLSQTLGSKLGLDVVDISSQGSLSSATVTVGKYLTNDLFMSYQRSLGQSQDISTSPDIVTLEYELNRFFSLQLLQGDEKTSGFDFIFKYQH